MRSLTQMLLAPLLAGPLGTVFSHWGVDGDGASLAAEFRDTIASMVCQIHSRFMLLFSSWPFPLTKVADPRFDDGEKRSCLRSFYGDPECCVDRHFGLKLRELCPELEDLLDDEAIVQGIRAWARNSPLTNMITERLLVFVQGQLAGQVSTHRAVDRHGPCLAVVARAHCCVWPRPEAY